MIREAIMENDFLKNLPSQQVREIVDYMEKKKVVAGAYVIKEGDTGTYRVFADIVFQIVRSFFFFGVKFKILFNSFSFYRKPLVCVSRG